MTRCKAPRVNGPNSIRSTASTWDSCNQDAARAPSGSVRRAPRTPTGTERRRAAKARTRTLDSSSHSTSSIATSTGDRSPSFWDYRQEAGRHRALIGRACHLHPPATGSGRSRGVAGTAGLRTRPHRRRPKGRPSEAYASTDSAAAGRAVNTRKPLSTACVTMAVDHSVVLPIPGPSLHDQGSRRPDRRRGGKLATARPSGWRLTDTGGHLRILAGNRCQRHVLPSALVIC